MGEDWDAGVSRAQGGQCRGKEPAGSPWTAWWTCWQEPRSVSHQLHQTHCLLLARPLLPGPVEQGPLAQGTSEGQGSPWGGRQMMPVDAWRSPPVWDSMWAAKDENRKSSVIDPLLGCRHSGSPPPRRPGLCRPQWSLDAKGWVGRVTIHGTESPSAPSTSPVALQCSCPTQAFGWGTPVSGRATCAEDSDPSSLG